MTSYVNIKMMTQLDWLFVVKIITIVHITLLCIMLILREMYVKVQLLSILNMSFHEAHNPVQMNFQAWIKGIQEITKNLGFWSKKLGYESFYLKQTIGTSKYFVHYSFPKQWMVKKAFRVMKYWQLYVMRLARTYTWWECRIRFRLASIQNYPILEKCIHTTES